MSDQSHTPNGSTSVILVRLHALEKLAETHNAKLDAMAVRLEHIGSTSCPRPGYCLELERRIGVAEGLIERKSGRLDKLNDTISAVSKEVHQVREEMRVKQAWWGGGLCAAILIVQIVGPWAAKALHLIP